MKSILLFLCFVLSNIVFSQKAHFIGYANSSLFSTVDTIGFGYDENCSIGIDIDCDELDYGNIDIESYDFRILHNNVSGSPSNVIGIDGSEILYDDYLELKKDYRKYDPFLESSKYFSIKIISGEFFGGYYIALNEFLTSNYKWKIYWKTKAGQDYSDWGLMWNSESQPATAGITIVPFFDGIDSTLIDQIDLFFLRESPTNTINLNNPDIFDYSINTSILKINLAGQLKVFNTMGQEVLDKWVSISDIIDLSGYNKGTYFLAFRQNHTGTIHSLKIVVM